MTQTHWTAFDGHKRLAGGPRQAVAQAVKRAHDSDPNRTILIFDDGTGRQIDIDLSGDEQAVLDRLGAEMAVEPRGRGRPKLGVVAREVTLLGRHWDWLAQQPGGASSALRKLVDAGMKSPEARRRQAQAVADRVMGALAGDLPHYEDASRALYAGDGVRFATLIADWPADVRDHIVALSAEAFAGA